MDSGLTRRTTLLSGIGTLGAAGVVARTGAAREGAEATSVASLTHLTARQQAGQRVIWSYPGASVPQALLDAATRGEVGGVIFFGENIPDKPTVAEACRRLRAAHASGPARGLPLVLTTDQEGGTVRRLPGAPEPSAKQVGASPDPATAARIAGDGAGRNLRSVGMNLNLAPVLDVFREPGNFDDQFGRSFSRDPRVVATCGAAFAAAQRRTGVASTLKHFPGLGAAPAGANTDLTPVRLDVPLAELRRVDEAPFGEVVRSGAELVMGSWAIYPALDADRPAGLSSRWLRGELRGRLRFGGVTITDALEAGSLSAYGDDGQRAVLAAEAGMDMLLASGRDVEQGRAVVDALTASQRRLTPQWYAALLRVAAMRRRLP
ncbi:glycoside hydrolase family 3 N-terminal domain-containing protein [Marmoricola endophyticus]|nr:glycoside hydrolase family 3 N-terminal domain-containing protein [Marmoricola endophyticus]